MYDKHHEQYLPGIKPLFSFKSGYMWFYQAILSSVEVGFCINFIIIANQNFLTFVAGNPIGPDSHNVFSMHHTIYLRFN
jgi:hypothetical protein